MGLLKALSKTSNAQKKNSKSMTLTSSFFSRGGLGGVKVLGKLPVPGRPTSLDQSRARAYCTCNTCGWGFFGHIFSSLSLLFSFSLSLIDGPI